MNNHFYIRIWCAVPDLTYGEVAQKRIAQLRKMGDAMQNNAGDSQIAEAFSKLDFVNAVEVIDQRSREGILIYPDWP